MNAHLLLLTALLASMAYESSATEGISAGTALAIGVAAVIGLKLAGVAGFAIARSFGGRRGGRGRGRRYRGRRDAVVALDVDQEEAYFQLVEQVDSLGCGLRVVCELEAREYSQLQADERIILSLFGSRPLPPTSNGLESASGKYQLAAFVGAQKKDAKRCARLFAKCPFSSEQLMAALRAAPGAQ
ncbi:uncharacterized protein LOC122388608 [Amphibalanus amphitrite]|uniref:uncharacterized protein LOC122388608 n=1 Tax=Amphibalanus amphitrite TaxID=1232801 RepID=UPI001C91D2E0|nr:uncharacterized protein LOC122388608 [Amphibalanus amphitrite]